MFRASHVQGTLALFARVPLFLLVALIALGIVIGPSIAHEQQLNLSWVDNSRGQAGFIIQRAPSSVGPYSQIAQIPLGITS